MSNKIALVTGSGRGIGRAIALKLAGESYYVVINYNSDEVAAQEVCDACRELGSDSIILKGNIADFNEAKEMVDTIVKRYGRLDVLVNNSGITKDGLILRMGEEDFSSVVNVNLNGTFYMTKHASKVMMKQRSGVIVNMASVIGEIGNTGQANYAASKAGVIGLTKSCAKEFAPRGIRVNAIAPGFIDTDMTAVLDENTKEQILANVPLKSFGTVDDIANLVSFLVSDNSRYITGQIINVDGGMVM